MDVPAAESADNCAVLADTAWAALVLSVPATEQVDTWDVDMPVAESADGFVALAEMEWGATVSELVEILTAQSLTRQPLIQMEMDRWVDRELAAFLLMHIHTIRLGVHVTSL